MRNICSSGGLLVTLLLVATDPVSAIEFGNLRALQNGPIGDAPAFSDGEGIEGEAAVSIDRAFGQYQLNGNSLTKTTSGDTKVALKAGGAYQAAKNFAAVANLTLMTYSDYNEDQQRLSPKSKFDSGHYRHSLDGYVIFRGKPLVVGGGLGLLLVGSETKTFDINDTEYSQEADSAAMPVLRLFGGFQSKTITALLGLRLFSQGESVVTAEDTDGNLYEYDIVRRNPGEVHADVKVSLGQTDLAVDLAYVLTGQSSPEADEWSLEFEQESATRRIRRTGGAKRNENHFRGAVGARFMPAKMVGVLGGLEYISPSYSKEQLASLEEQNLGGFYLNLGADVLMKQFRGFLQLRGTVLDSTVNYTQDDATRGLVAVARTQKGPVEQGDRVKMSQGSFSFLLGGGMRL